MDSNLDTALQSVKSTLETLETDGSFDANSLITKHGVSLLTLKNHALISYLQNSALVLLSQVERSSTSTEVVAELRDKAVRNTITQRVVLEKGIKGLESKISYQVEKSLRAYAKSKAESAKAAEKVNDEDQEDQEDGDLLMFKPNPKLLLSSKKDQDVRQDDDEKSTEKVEKYQPPKISATTPFGASNSAKKTSQHKRKNALMEDYLESTSIAPIAEPSIGSTIIDHGRGGVSTARERRKEKEILDYEETNYTRLSSITRKQQEKEKKKKRGSTNSDSFFGEDWGFSGSSNVDSATTRKKSSSVWDRAKRRRRS